MRILLVVFLLSSTGFAKAPELPCGDRVAQSPVARVVPRLAAMLALGGDHFEVLPDADQPTLVIGGLDEAEFAAAQEALREAQHILAGVGYGKIRGYRGFSLEQATIRSLLWGSFLAITAAAAVALPPDTLWPLVPGAKGAAFFSLIKTLRWLKTVDLVLRRTTGQAESNLWSALGPMQGPLQFWLHDYFTDQVHSLVVVLGRPAVSRVREWYGRGGREAIEDIVPVTLARP